MELSPELIDTIIGYATSVVGVLVFIIVVWIVAGWIGRQVRNSLERSPLDDTLTSFFPRLAQWLVIIVGVVMALGIFGIQTASFAAVIGAAGLAIGLAFQGTLAHFAAGVMMLIFRPINVGDVVKLEGEFGTIREIDLVLTKMDTFDNRRVTIPNGEVFSSSIITLNAHEVRRVDVPVGADYDADIDATRAALERALPNIVGALEEPAPQIVLDGLGGSSVDWTVRAWAPTPDWLAVKQSTIRAIKMALDEAEIGIPFPQMDVHLDGELDRYAATRSKGSTTEPEAT